MRHIAENQDLLAFSRRGVRLRIQQILIGCNASESSIRLSDNPNTRCNESEALAFRHGRSIYELSHKALITLLGCVASSLQSRPLDVG